MIIFLLLCIEEIVQLLDLPNEIILSIMNKIESRMLLLCSIISIGNNRLEELALDGCYSIDLTFDYFQSPYKLLLRRFYSDVMPRIGNQIQSLTFNIPHICDLINFAEQNCNGTLPNLKHVKITSGIKCNVPGVPYTLSKLLLSVFTKLRLNITFCLAK